MSARVLDAAALRAVLDAHRRWLLGQEGGTRAVLTRAVLTGAVLEGAVLEGAVLEGAVLEGAVLEGADLTDADLRGADLRGADLADANLTRADLRGADLRGAALAGAALAGAALAGAALAGAVLADADLRDADLTGADLTGADTSAIREDVYEILGSAPAEVPGLLAALREGRVDGSTYEGECACLVGTLEHCGARGLPRDSSRLAERWFLAIRPGDTPARSPIAALTVEWVEAWIAARPTQVRS